MLDNYFRFNSMNPHLERVRKVGGTVGLIYCTFQTDDEKVAQSDGVSVPIPCVGDQGPVDVKIQMKLG